MKDWTKAEIETASKAMKEMGEMSFEEFTAELEKQDSEGKKDETKD